MGPLGLSIPQLTNGEINMSDPQQPWNQQPQQPQQPQWGAPPQQPQWGAQPQQPQWGAPPPPQAGGPGGAIALDLKYSPVLFTLGLFKPRVEINGQEVARGWGRQLIPVPAGQYYLHVHVKYLFPSRIGNADLPVAVYPGQTVELEYRAPAAIYFGGSLGPAPQKYNGMVFTVIMLVIGLVVLVCACGGVFDGGSPNSTIGMPSFDLLSALLGLLA
jgi:hypothetical protein